MAARKSKPAFQWVKNAHPKKPKKTDRMPLKSAKEIINFFDEQIAKSKKSSKRRKRGDN